MTGHDACALCGGLGYISDGSHEDGMMSGRAACPGPFVRPQPATEERETFAAVNKALAYLDGEPSEMALAAARATLLSLRAALAAPKPAGDEHDPPIRWSAPFGASDPRAKR